MLSVQLSLNQDFAYCDILPSDPLEQSPSHSCRETAGLIIFRFFEEEEDCWCSDGLSLGLSSREEEISAPAAAANGRLGGQLDLEK